MDNSRKEIIQNLFNAFDQFNKLDWNQSPVAGLKRSEVFTLFSIKRIMDSKSSSVKITDISKSLGVAPPTITQLITGLKQKGYVERSINTNDRRSVQIVLTEKGWHAIDKASNVFNKYFEGVVEYLGEEKSNELVNLLVMVFNYFKNIDGSTNAGVIRL